MRKRVVFLNSFLDFFFKFAGAQSNALVDFTEYLTIMNNECLNITQIYFCSLPLSYTLSSFNSIPV